MRFSELPPMDLISDDAGMTPGAGQMHSRGNPTNKLAGLKKVQHYQTLVW
jgi:hypothetical protein